VPPAKLPARVRVAVEDGKPSPPPAAKPGVAAEIRPAVAGGKPGAKAGPQKAAGGKAGPNVVPAAGRGEVVVSASGPFRVLDSKGNIVVPVATGTWKVVPAAKGVRLLPPRDQAGAPGLTVLGVEPAAALPGQPLIVRFRSNLPGLLSATAQPPGGPTVPVVASQVTGTGERRLTLPAATQPGPYSLTLTTDSGPGRTATLTVTPAVADPNAPPPPPAGSTEPGGLLGTLPDAGLLDGGLSQTLIAAPPSAPDAMPPLAPQRASRSAAVRPSLGPPASSPGPASDHNGLGVLLAALCGLAVWRFRARPNWRSFSALFR